MVLYQLSQLQILSIISVLVTTLLSLLNNKAKILISKALNFIFFLYGSNIPTIFLTAKDEEESVVKGLELGAEDYITKPFSSKELNSPLIIITQKKDLRLSICFHF